VQTSLINPSLLLALPFGALLAGIALAPLFFSGWWGKHYGKVVSVLAALVVSYYVVILRAGPHVWHTATEYISFICLVGSLFIISYSSFRAESTSVLKGKRLQSPM
jgi:hypothetical protein